MHPRAEVQTARLQQCRHPLAPSRTPLESAVRTTTSLLTGDLDQQLRAVERTMNRLARSARVDRAGSMVLEQLGTGGRRLRARLALLTARVYRVPDETAIAWAAAVELLHNATLVHDDIQDGDTIRRGHPTLWAKHGVAQAINAGDLLLMLPFLAFAELPPTQSSRASLLLAQAATHIVRGQVEELSLLTSGRLDMQSYMSAAAGKTGELFALPVRGAALLGGASEAEADELGQVFTRLGVIFQLQDDVVDLFGDKGRGEIGCDIYEGKVSALVVAHVEQSPETSTELLEILARPRALTTPRDVQTARELFLASEALDLVLGRIKHLEQDVLESDIWGRLPALWNVAEELRSLALAPIEHLFEDTREAAV